MALDLYLVCSFYITVFHCFCGQIMVALLKCFFLNLDCPVPTPEAIVTCPKGQANPPGWWGVLGPSCQVSLIWGSATPHQLGFVSGPVVRRIEKALRDKVFYMCNNPKISQIKILIDFEIGFLFRIKIRTRTDNFFRYICVTLQNVIKLWGSLGHMIYP